jgi:hypothetical protein
MTIAQIKKDLDAAYEYVEQSCKSFADRFDKLPEAEQVKIVAAVAGVVALGALASSVIAIPKRPFLGTVGALVAGTATIACRDLFVIADEKSDTSVSGLFRQCRQAVFNRPNTWVLRHLAPYLLSPSPQK